MALSVQSKSLQRIGTITTERRFRSGHDDRSQDGSRGTGFRLWDRRPRSVRK